MKKETLPRIARQGPFFRISNAQAQGEAHHQEIDRKGDQKNAQRRIEFRNARPQPDFEQYEVRSQG